MKVSGIYGIKNTLTGKLYVGQSLNMFVRCRNHRHELKKGRHINTEMQWEHDSYGAQYFIFGIIEECPPELLNTKEAFWIEKFNTLEKGYNKAKVTDRVYKYRDGGSVSVILYDKDTLEEVHRFDCFREFASHFSTDSITIGKMLNKIYNLEDKHWYYRNYIVIKGEMTLETFLNRRLIYKLNKAIEAYKNNTKAVHTVIPPRKRQCTDEQLSEISRINAAKANEVNRLRRESAPLKYYLYNYYTGEFVGSYKTMEDAGKSIGSKGGRLGDVLSGRRNHTKGYTIKLINN